MSELRWADLFPAIAGDPRGAPGYLDWTTGVVRINTSYEAWERIKSAKDLEEQKQSAFFCSFCRKGDREVNSMIAG